MKSFSIYFVHLLVQLLAFIFFFFTAIQIILVIQGRSNLFCLFELSGNSIFFRDVSNFLCKYNTKFCEDRTLPQIYCNSKNKFWKSVLSIFFVKVVFLLTSVWPCLIFPPKDLKNTCSKYACAVFLKNSYSLSNFC